jgi:hypothetical protein
MLKLPDDIENIINLVHEEILEHWPEKAKNEFFLGGYAGADLIRYHHSLGQHIRNKFKLWNRDWKPDIRDGVDYSPFHPDQISMTIIQEVWKRGVTERKLS